MNKAELVNEVAERIGTTQAKAEYSLQQVLEAIKKGIESDGNVKIKGFGTFTKTVRAARAGRNPQTGAAIQIAEKNVIKFKPYFE